MQKSVDELREFLVGFDAVELWTSIQEAERLERDRLEVYRVPLARSPWIAQGPADAPVPMPERYEASPLELRAALRGMGQSPNGKLCGLRRWTSL